MSNERNRDGQFNKEHTDEEYIDAVERQEPAGTRAVADDLGVNIETARLRLKQLAEQNEIEQDELGGRLVFSIQD